MDLANLLPKQMPMTFFWPDLLWLMLLAVLLSTALKQ